MAVPPAATSEAPLQKWVPPSAGSANGQGHSQTFRAVGPRASAVPEGLWHRRDGTQPPFLAPATWAGIGPRALLPLSLQSFRCWSLCWGPSELAWKDLTSGLSCTWAFGGFGQGEAPGGWLDKEKALGAYGHGFCPACSQLTAGTSGVAACDFSPGSQGHPLPAAPSTQPCKELLFLILWELHARATRFQLLVCIPGDRCNEDRTSAQGGAMGPGHPAGKQRRWDWRLSLPIPSFTNASVTPGAAGGRFIRMQGRRVFYPGAFHTTESGNAFRGL